MRLRDTPLGTPPDRPPYFGVVVAGATVHLRTPSLHRVGRMLQAVTPDQQNRLAGMVGMLGAGPAPMTVVTSAPDVLELFGAFVGVAWADPLLELETPAWKSGDLATYGASVFEELHESGWALQQVVMAGLALAREAFEANRLDKEVTEQAAFFLRPKAPSSSRGSTSSAPSSEPMSGDPSES